MQPFLSVSQVSVLCIVYNVPAVFVLILLGDFLYIVVYIQNIFGIVPFHCQSCPAAVYFYILNISYLYVRSLKCSGTISLNGFLGLKDYFIICLSGSSTVSWLWQSWMSFKLFLHIITALEFGKNILIAPRQHWCSCSPRLLLFCVALHHIAWHDLLLIAFRSTGCCSTCADKNAKFLMASRAWVWLRANAAPLGVCTPVVGVFASYAWNATETHRMARQIRRGHFQPKAPVDYDHRFCLFDRYMMEKARMVGLVGLKSTGKSSTLSHFLREKPNPFYLSLTDGNVYDAMYDQMKDSVLRLPFFAHHLRWDAGKNSKKIVIEVFELVQEQTGSRCRWGWMWCWTPRHCL